MSSPAAERLFITGVVLTQVCPTEWRDKLLTDVVVVVVVVRQTDKVTPNHPKSPHF